MAELVDALVSGTSVSNGVQVRVLFWALFDIGHLVICKHYFWSPIHFHYRGKAFIVSTNHLYADFDSAYALWLNQKFL
jgi:hypothetical protein